MQKSKFTRIPHTYFSMWVRVLLLFVFLCGTQLAALISLHTQVKASHINQNARIIKTHTHDLVTDFDLQLVSATSSYTVGQKVTYTLTATNVSSSDYSFGAINIADTLIASGLAQIQATAGSSWSITSIAPDSPSIFTATYTGSYPIVAGEILPPITITGILTSSALGDFVNRAVLNVDGDSDLSNNSVLLTIRVSPVSTPIAIDTPTEEVTPTEEPTVAVTPPVGPDLGINLSTESASPLQSGQPVTYDLSVVNASAADLSVVPGLVTVTDVIPVGLENIVVSGSGWSLVAGEASSTQMHPARSLVSPTVVTAIYNASTVLPAGGALPPFQITGDVTDAALPRLTNTVSVLMPGDNNPINDSSFLTLPVIPAIEPTVEVTPTLEPTIEVTPTEEPTIEVTPTAIPSTGQPDMSVAFSLPNVGGNVQTGSSFVTDLVVSNTSTQC